MPMSDVFHYVRTQYEEKPRPREETGPGHHKVGCTTILFAASPHYRIVYFWAHQYRRSPATKSGS